MVQTSWKETFLLFVVFTIRINDKMIICNGNKILNLDYDVIRHWIHLKETFLIESHPKQETYFLKN